MQPDRDARGKHQHILAKFRALAAMIIIVLRAFKRTQPAGSLTDDEKFMADFRTPLQQRRSEKADVSTITIQLDASGHHGHVCFV
jgi:hypothetical protein